MTRDELKYAELGIKLEKLNMRLKKDNGFLRHMKKMAKAYEVEYEEEVAPHARKLKKSPQRSPDASPVTRNSIHSRPD